MDSVHVVTVSGSLRANERAPSAARARILRAVGALAIPAALALLTFAVFSPGLWGGFVEWDDQVTLYENPNWRGLSAPQLKYFFTTFLMGHYIPVTWLTFGLDYVLWGMNPFGYHLTSLVIFALGAGVLYFVALHLLGTSMALTGAPLKIGAVAATLFFAIHPLRAESVAWATERRDVLSALFFLLTVLAYLKARDASGRRRRTILAASVGCYALALLSKGSVMVLPAILILLDVYPLRRIGGPWRAWFARPAWPVWLEKVPFAVLGLAGAIVTYQAQAANLFITPFGRQPLASRIAMSFYSLWFYIEKTVMPLGLSPLYELPARVNPFEPRFLVATLAVSALVAVLLALARRWPAGLAVFVYYAICVGPVMGIVHSGHQLTHDRFSYLPGFGLALLAGAAAGAVARADAARTLRPAITKALAFTGIAWTFGLAVLTAHQTQIWHDTDGLWRYAIESDPKCGICYGNLGVYLSKQGHTGLALQYFTTVLEIRPDHVKAYKHLGYTYATLGEWERAITNYRRYLVYRPEDADVLNNLGAALISAKRPGEALEPLRRAVRNDRAHVFAHTNLALATFELGRPEEALRRFRHAIALKFDTPQPWLGFARTSLELGRTDAARTAHGILTMLDRQKASLIGPLLLATW